MEGLVEAASVTFTRFMPQTEQLTLNSKCKKILLNRSGENLRLLKQQTEAHLVPDGGNRWTLLAPNLESKEAGLEFLNHLITNELQKEDKKRRPPTSLTTVSVAGVTGLKVDCQKREPKVRLSLEPYCFQRSSSFLQMIRLSKSNAREQFGSTTTELKGRLQLLQGKHYLSANDWDVLGNRHIFRHFFLQIFESPKRQNTDTFQAQVMEERKMKKLDNLLNKIMESKAELELACQRLEVAKAEVISTKQK